VKNKILYAPRRHRMITPIERYPISDIADGGNRNHSGRGGKTHKTLEEKGTGMGRGAK
jgi:hypothetical protein